MDQFSSIQRFYKDKVVLLTGGTGFLGLVLIEKLLRSCPDIRHLYLLMRERNGLTAENRMKTLINDEIFFRLKKEQPKFADKLVIISGDLDKPNLGLTHSDVALVIQNVDIILHSAATVNFNERLKTAIQINVGATKQLCYLAQNITNLKAFVYVSTAFSNCEEELIPESVCPSPLSPDKLLELAELLDEEHLDNITSNLLSQKPNTYVLSKSAAENVIFEFRSSFPVAILRPSIVVPTAEEPTPGWVNNYNGATGSVAGLSAGFIHTFIYKRNCQANIVPVDRVANAIIALAFVVASRKWKCLDGEEDMAVINFVAKSSNCMTWGNFFDCVERLVYEYPSQHLKWYPFCLSAQNTWTLTLHTALLHHLPAAIIDFVTAQCGSPTKLRKLCKKFDKYVEAVSYFSTRQFIFEERNCDLMWKLLETQDRQLFPFNMADMNWVEFMRGYVIGCRRYLLRENDSTLERSRCRIKVLYCIHWIFKWACVLASMRIGWAFLGCSGLPQLSKVVKLAFCFKHL